MHLYLFFYLILFNSFSYSFLFKHLFRKKIQQNDHKYTIFHNKEKKSFKYNNINDYFYDNKYLENKKIINIYPAGIKGFYEMGLCTYIKENNNLENIVFSGASAGAWNALLLAYKGDVLEFKKIIFDIPYKDYDSIFQIQQKIKQTILSHFTSDDFNLKQLFVGLTVLDNFKFKTFIYTDFESLEDALNCIIGSSNIPFITGKLFYFYKGRLSFDGGFKKDPFIHHPSKSIYIHPCVFNKNNILNDDTHKASNISDCSIIENNEFIVDNETFIKLFIQGYNDALNNKDIIQKNLLSQIP